MPCPLSSISCRGGCYHPDLKSSKQVVHLQGDLLKVQIYQPFSRTGCVLPWHTNRIFVICRTLHAGVLFRSIAYFVCKVEGIIQMSISGYFPLQFQLRPSELMCGLDIPCPLLEGQLRFQNNCVLRPANRHSLSHHLWSFFICPVKLPHPAKVPGGEAGDARVSAGQILCGGDSGSFLRPGADQPANLTVQIHLRAGLPPSGCPAPQTWRCSL